VKNFVIAFLFLATSGSVAHAQTGTPTVLRIDIDNFVQYQEDTSDISAYATNQSITPVANPPRNFAFAVAIGDVVSVNGQPASGTVLIHLRNTFLRTTAATGQAIADTTRNSLRHTTIEILASDGTPVGTIMGAGLLPFAAPPGAPSDVIQGNDAIVGGTGAFWGARGTLGQAAATVPSRTASITEDPANRRRNGGGRLRWVLYLIPHFQPQVLSVTHSNDFTVVTTSRPATAGENLSLFATDLGPTRPALDPGQTFPSNPPALANSPVQVTVNGRPAQVLAAVGFPGTANGYQVNFRLPPDTARGEAIVQLGVAWIAAPPLRISVQ
jgi:uncharacterized protein (TIGR03437 family)